MAKDKPERSDGTAEELEKVSRRMPWVILAIFGGIGLVCLVIAVVTGVGAARRITREVSAQGVVVTLVTDYNSDGDTIYYPVVEFTLPNGKETRVQSSFGTSPPAFWQGQTVTVLYEPENPQGARIQSFWGLIELWLGTLITGILGTSFTGAAIWARKELF
jgi:hypothetical protein